MADPAPAAAPAAAPPAADGAGPWHSGVEADTVGFWENKGWGKDNPKDFAVNITKSYRELENHLHAPPERLLRMPGPDAKPEDIKAFWQRLGAPDKPTEYDFSSVKFNGEDLEDGFVATMRDALAQAYVPKDKAAAIAGAVIKYLESADTTEKTMTTAKIAEEKAALARNWGPNFDFNHLKAMEGARIAKVPPEAVKAMENQIGYAAVMEHFRRIGSGMSEEQWVDTGVSPSGGPGGMPVTREGAISRLAELKADKEGWTKRLLSGNKEAEREMVNLIKQIDGESTY